MVKTSLFLEVGPAWKDLLSKAVGKGAWGSTHCVKFATLLGSGTGEFRPLQRGKEAALFQFFGILDPNRAGGHGLVAGELLKKPFFGPGTPTPMVLGADEDGAEEEPTEEAREVATRFLTVTMPLYL